MTEFEPRDPDFEARVRESFARQTLMGTIGARLVTVSPGAVEIELPFREDLSQQHGYLHAGVVTAIVDTACGYSALTLMDAGAEVLTIEYKINFVSPALGERLVARGRVTRPGRTVTVCAGDVFAEGGGKVKLVASMLATMISLRGEKGA
ncbi:MAG TPA: PaaI family thioesterase [Blastocatellia bacterium]|nr:PaaI family thioesterase [Blastocatellia bacterium]